MVEVVVASDEGVVSRHAVQPGSAARLEPAAAVQQHAERDVLVRRGRLHCLDDAHVGEGGPQPRHRHVHLGRQGLPGSVYVSAEGTPD